MRIVKVVCGVCVALTACTSQPASQPISSANSAKRTLQELNGSKVATPLGLFLTSLDTDRDTAVSPGELNTGVELAFKAGDLDGSGSISPIEFADWSVAYLGSNYTTPSRLQFDRNQDSSVSPDEFAKTFSAIFHRLDSDQSGSVQRSELLVQIEGVGLDPLAMQAQMESEMRSKMQQMCRRGGRAM